MVGHMQQPKKPDERNFLSFFLYFEGRGEILIYKEVLKYL